MKDSLNRRLVMICFLVWTLPLFTSTFVGQWQLFWVVLVAVTLPTLILAIWITVYIKRRVISPLDALVEQADRISSGDLSQPIRYGKDDELGHFVSSFERMRSNLYARQQQQQAFEAERKNFITGISHDLRTPIASISAYIEALQDHMAATPEEEAHYFHIIEKKLSVLTELSQQLSLSYANPDTLPLDLQEVNCYDWTAGLFGSIRSECLLRGLSPSLDNRIGPKDQSTMCIDHYQLERAVQNVLSNSYRYTRHLLSLSSAIEDQYLVLRVKNDGVQLAPDKSEKIFERFYTEEHLEAQGHLGLGLSIARTIIQSMKGTVQAAILEDTITFEIRLEIEQGLSQK